MKKFVFVVLFVIFSSFFSRGATAQGWIKAESDHFVFYSEASPDITRDYLTALENYHHFLKIFLPGTKKDESGNKFTIYFPNSSSGFRKVIPGISSNVGGFVTYCEDGIFAISSLERGKLDKNVDLLNRRDNDSITILFHEYAHEFMFRYSGASFPKWFVEGFAEYYSTMRIGNNGEVLVGVPDADRIGSLNGFKSSYVDIIREELKINSQSQAAEVYAQYWLLTHYFLSSPELSTKLNTYFEKRLDAKDKGALFEEIFGIKLDKLDEHLEKYRFSSARMHLMELTPANVPEITIEALSPSISDAILINAALDQCPSESHLKDIHNKLSLLSNKNPENIFLKTSLMKAKILIGSTDEAIAFFKSQTESQEKDPWNWFYLGKAQYFKGLNENNSDIAMSNFQLARQSFFQAYRLDPKNPTNLYYLSLTAENEESPDEASVNAGIEAYLLEPSISEYALNAIRLEVETDQFEYAIQDLELLLGRTHSKAKQEPLRAALLAIKENKKKNEIISLLDKAEDDEE